MSEHTEATADTLPEMNALLDVIRALVGEIHPKWKNLHFTPDTHLERELGLDSMARMELRTRIESQLGITLEESAAISATTPHALMQALTIQQGNMTDAGAAATNGNNQASELLMGSFGVAATDIGEDNTHDLFAWLYAIYAWAIFIIIGATCWVFLMVSPGAHLRRKLAHYFARLFFLLTFTPLRISGQQNLLTDKPQILVANHASYLDGFIATAVLDIPFHFIVKGEIAGNLPARLMLQRFGVEFVDRFNASKGSSTVTRIAEKTRNGHSIMFFPEGTFTSFPGLQPFRMGAFVTATRTGSPVVPIAIEGARSIVRGNDWFPHRGSLTVTIRPPITPDKNGWSTALALRNAARHEISPYTGEPDLIEGENGTTGQSGNN